MRIIMNSTLTTTSRHAEQLHPEQRAPRTRRVGVLDRAALHLGVALIKWGRRPSVQPGRERRASRLERALASRERDAHVVMHRENFAREYALMTRMR
jgi:hypothetical protein